MRIPQPVRGPRQPSRVKRSQGAGTEHSEYMPVVIALDVLPMRAQVVLLDAAWQDHPD
jgi:hypothetical protein